MDLLAAYQPGLVAVSFLVATFGAASGFSAARWIYKDGATRIGWLLLSAIILGACMAWSAHYLGMLALAHEMPMTFDARMSAIALAIPILSFIPGLYLGYRWGHIHGVIPLAAAFIGVGLATLNYIGAAAIRVQGSIVHDEFFLFAGGALAVAVTIPAMYLARNSQRVLRHMAAPVMGLAVLGMYLVSMGGFEIIPDGSEVDYFTGALTPPVMLLIVGLMVVVFSVLGLTLGLSQESTSDPIVSESTDKIAEARAEIQRRRSALQQQNASANE